MIFDGHCVEKTGQSNNATGLLFNTLKGVA